MAASAALASVAALAAAAAATLAALAASAALSLHCRHRQVLRQVHSAGGETLQRRPLTAAGARVHLRRQQVVEAIDLCVAATCQRRVSELTNVAYARSRLARLHATGAHEAQLCTEALQCDGVGPSGKQEGICLRNLLVEYRSKER